MVKNTLLPILTYLRKVLGASANSGVSDADLLERYVAERDQAAFELLLWRHAAMVLHVCCQVLGDANAAEDAFQATFLVFVRKAGSIGRRESLGAWLYRVAYHIALKERTRRQKRTATPAELDLLEAPAESDVAEQRELRRIVCEEVNRLPPKYRAPIVACFFEGKTHQEAALQLGWPLGTVAGRLARARELLHRRLLRRGVTLALGAILGALSVRTAQAALTGLVDSVIHTTRLLMAGQAASAVVSPSIAALAKGVLHAMYWTKLKIGLVTLLLAGIGGVGVTLLATQEQKHPPTPNRGPSPQPWQGPVVDRVQAQANEPDVEDYQPAEEPPSQAPSPEEAAKLARNMAQSRLNLRKLALAMINYADTYNGQMPLAATVGKNGKALLSWRVELLPYIEEQALYNQFKRDEPWNSPHNIKLLSKMPAVFAPPGVKTQRPYSTYYQVFVSNSSSGNAAAGGAGAPGMPGGMRGGPPGMMPPGGMAPGLGIRPGMPGGMPAMPGGMGPPGSFSPITAFVKGKAMRYPASFVDGTSNTILIVEAGNPVPWTKPEDLHYAEDEPLPELGGLFPDVFHAVFADGKVHTLTRKFSEKQMRRAITINDGEVLDWTKIEAKSRRRAVGDASTVETWQRKNEELRKEVAQLREQLRVLKEEEEVERELAGEDPRIGQLKDEHAHMQAELKKLRAELEALKKDIRRPH